jgi:hypothetical protein
VLNKKPVSRGPEDIGGRVGGVGEEHV